MARDTDSGVRQTLRVHLFRMQSESGDVRKDHGEFFSLLRADRFRIPHDLIDHLSRHVFVEDCPQLPALFPVTYSTVAAVANETASASGNGEIEPEPVRCKGVDGESVVGGGQAGDAAA